MCKAVQDPIRLSRPITIPYEDDWPPAAANQSIGGLGNEPGVGVSKHFDPANEDDGRGKRYLFTEPCPEPPPCCELLVVRAGMIMGFDLLRPVDA